MKKTILLCILAALCLHFTSEAQDISNTNPLKIGDKVPDIIINNIINYKSAEGKSVTSAKISDFRGKLLILDFWATWCAPCIGMIPKMDSLQMKFPNSLHILPVAYQNKKVIFDFRQKNQSKNPGVHRPEVVGDSTLIKLFPHTYLPHYVWISPEGVVVAITSYEEVTEDHIRRFLTRSSGALPVKEDEKLVPYNALRPLFINQNGGNGSTLLYHSVLSAYTKGLAPGVTELPADSIKGLTITLRNVSLLWMYQTAFGEKKDFFPLNRIKVFVVDPSRITSSLRGMAYLEWMKSGNTYCYELTVPPSLVGNAYHIMQNDLQTFFSQYTARVEKQSVECLVLVRTSKSDKLHSTGGLPEASSDMNGFRFVNQPLSGMVFQLNYYYMQTSPYPVVDETGIKENVDIVLEANPSNLVSMNAALVKYDLKLVMAKRNINVIAIRDTKPN
jgi:thiol-disulfide isomerase/thioredoxin